MDERHRVHLLGLLAINHVAEESHHRRAASPGDPDGGVLGSRGSSIPVRLAVRRGENGVECVHDRLHLGRGVGGSSDHARAVQRAIDGSQIVCGDPGHPRGRVGAGRGLEVSRVVGLGGGGNGRQGTGLGLRQGLQLGEGVDPRAVVGRGRHAGQEGG